MISFSTNRATPASAAFRILAVFALASVIAACAGRSTDGLTAASVPPGTAETGKSYVQIVKDLPYPAGAKAGTEQTISKNDVLKVDIFQVDDLDREVEVDATGRISLPLIGGVQAAGKTPRELEAEITKRYGAKYLQSPEVTIFMVKSAGQSVTIIGEVARTGNYVVTSQSTLINTLAQAGGLKEIADPEKIYIARAVKQKQYVANFKVSEINAGKRADPRIFAGDKIVIYPSTSKVALKNLGTAMGFARSVIWLGAL